MLSFRLPNEFENQGKDIALERSHVTPGSLNPDTVASVKDAVSLMDLFAIS
jgi:hypothetical protein